MAHEVASVPAARLVRQILEEVADFGRRQDARESERTRRMLNVTPEAGQLLAILVRATRAQRILELGTSNGYSTLWLAWGAAETGGHVETIECADDKVAMARSNIARAGLADRVTMHHGLALEVVRGLAGPYDLIFLDADRPSYLVYLEHLLRLLRAGGLLVTDNVVSHAHELGDFLGRLKTHPLLESVTLAVGNGEELTYKRG